MVCIRVQCSGLCGALLALAAGCAATPQDPASPAAATQRGAFHFTDVAAEAGLTRVLLAGRPEKDHLLDSTGAGAAWLDYDGDGWLDLYLLNGWRLEQGRVVERGRNALYRNRGDGTFEDVTDIAGVDGEGCWCIGVAVADYDNDGFDDLFVSAFGPNLLYRNRGDGTFENVAAAAGVEAPGWNTGAAFFDADGDGDLDLYVAAYIDQTIDDVLAARPTLDWKGVDKVAVGPFGLDGAADHFFVSNGDGTFTEATEEAGLADRSLGYGFAVIAFDPDNDGDMDIYVANDSDANYLYRNDGTGRFREIGLWSGAAFDINGAAQAGMGIAVGEATGDAHVDLVVTNFSEDFTTLYAGEGGGFFRDASDESGVGAATYLSLSWGAVLADLDHDGDLDLVIANGHIYPQVDRHPEFGMSYAQRNQLLENLGGGRFAEVTDRAGPGFQISASSRGLAAGDYDNDGDLDLLITRLDAPPLLLRNDSASGRWLIVSCRTGAGDGPSIGTRVTVEAGGRSFVRDVSSSGSFLSAHDPRVHFGLGDATVATVHVRWPDGSEQVLSNVETNRIVEVRRGD